MLSSVRDRGLVGLRGPWLVLFCDSMRDIAVRIMPEHGDVIIRQHVHDGRRAFALHTVPGPEQCVLHSRDEAVRQAVVFGKRAHVRVWSTDDGAGFVLLDDFRRVKR
jgi:hypothetical protein